MNKIIDDVQAAAKVGKMHENLCDNHASDLWDNTVLGIEMLDALDLAPPCYVSIDMKGAMDAGDVYTMVHSLILHVWNSKDVTF